MYVLSYLSNILYTDVSKCTINIHEINISNFLDIFLSVCATTFSFLIKSYS